MFGNLTGTSILTLLYISFAEGLTVFNRFTRPRDGYKVQDSRFDREVTCPSIAACAAICLQEEYCRTVSFNDGRCLQFDTSTTSTALSEAYLENKSGWLTLSKVDYTIFVAVYPDHRMLTYGDAANLCTDYNTVIATPEDMLATAALGKTTCLCGWVSGEKIQHVSSVGPCTSCDQTSTIVWCRL